MTLRTSPATALLALAGLVVVSCRAEAFVNRQARLMAHVVTSDGRAGVPCTATALLFGETDAQAETVAGSDVVLTVGMTTPLKVQAPIRARVALRVVCQGYGTVTTPDRETEVAATNPPKVEFGTISSPLLK